MKPVDEHDAKMQAFDEELTALRRRAAERERRFIIVDRKYQAYLLRGIRRAGAK